MPCGQAEHPDPQDRRQAPVLAVWDGARLAPSTESAELRGYGGAVAARPGGGFVVGCPRANAVALFDSQARWQQSLALSDACAVTTDARWWWAAGSTGVLQAEQGQDALAQLARAHLAPRWDNHWRIWPHQTTADQRT